MTRQTLKICHQDIPVVEDSGLSEHGYFNDARGPEIRINPQGLKRSAVRNSTILHEALHAIFALTGFNEELKNEELLVRALEVHLVNFLRDNRGFTNALIKEKPWRQPGTSGNSSS